MKKLQRFYFQIVTACIFNFKSKNYIFSKMYIFCETAKKTIEF